MAHHKNKHGHHVHKHHGHHGHHHHHHRHQEKKATGSSRKKKKKEMSEEDKIRYFNEQFRDEMRRSEATVRKRLALRLEDEGLKSKKLLIVFIITTGLCILLFCFQIYMTTTKLGGPGSPPTERAYESVFKTSIGSVILCFCCLSGFVIIQYRITNIAGGLFWILCVTISMWYFVNAISSTLSSIREDDFDSIIAYSNSYYKSSSIVRSQRFPPEYLINYQEVHKCCGWGPMQAASWLEIFDDDMTDKHLPLRFFPENCCKNDPENPDNIKVLNQCADLIRGTKREPSGDIIFENDCEADEDGGVVNPTYYNDPYFVDLTNYFNKERERTVEEQTCATDRYGFFGKCYHELTYNPDEINNFKDKSIFDKDEKKSPCTPVNDLLFQLDKVTQGQPSKDKKFPFLLFFDSRTRTCIYYISRGFANQDKIKRSMYDECENFTPIDRQNGYRDRNDKEVQGFKKFLTQIKRHMWVNLFFGFILLTLDVFVFSIFWRYYGNLRALELNTNELSPDYHFLNLQRMNYEDFEVLVADEITRKYKKDINKFRGRVDRMQQIERNLEKDETEVEE